MCVLLKLGAGNKKGGMINLNGSPVSIMRH